MYMYIVIYSTGDHKFVKHCILHIKLSTVCLIVHFVCNCYRSLDVPAAREIERLQAVRFVRQVQMYIHVHVQCTCTLL